MQFFLIFSVIAYFVYDELPRNFALLILGAGSIVAYIVYKLFFVKDYLTATGDKYIPSRAWDAGSFANFRGQTAGRDWTTVTEVILKLGEKNGLILDRFVFSRFVLNKLFLKKFIAQFYMDRDLTIKAEDLKTGALVIGKMGAGKTVFYDSILAQNNDYKHFKRVFIHDIKGDFTSKFFDQERDIILNPYDSRSQIWDFFAEKEFAIVENFIRQFFVSKLGSENDFFSSSAQDRYMTIVKTIFHNKKLETSNEKWEFFILAIDAYFEEVAKIEGKDSEKDIAQTMRLIRDFFALQFFLLKKGSKSFTIAYWLKTEKTKLILLNNPLYSESLNAYFQAFLSVFSSALAAKKEARKDDLTLLVLDEYLSLVDKISDDAIKQLHTLIRSKGGCLIAGIQYIPEEKNLDQKLLSSDWYFIFETTDPRTIQKIKDLIGKAVYTKTSSSANVKAKVAFKNGENTNTEESYLLQDGTLSKMDYGHITFNSKKGVLYLGKTVKINIKEIHDDFSQADLAEFYLS